MVEVDVMEEGVDETVDERETNPFLQIAHRVLLAGIGAVALAQEEIEEFVDRLVERGEIAEKDGRKMVTDVLDRRRRRAEEAKEETVEAVESATSEVDARIEAILHRMNVPAKSDIDALSRKIALLTEKVDQLKKTQEN